MRFLSLFAAALTVGSLVFSVVAQDEFEDEQIIIEGDAEDFEPQLLAAAAWPETNPFGHVVNGEKNTIGVIVENRLAHNTTLLNVAGAFYNPDTDVLIRNLSAMSYNVPLIEGTKLQLPYTFFSEFKPGDLRLVVWLDHLNEGEKQRVFAYDSIVTIVEPEGSWFDFKLISTYLIVLSLFAGLGYVAYLSFVPQSKKTRKAAVSAPVNVTATGAGGYQEEWIPSHHLKSRKKGGAASSGDELSGGETSGTEGKRRKTKK